MDSLEGRLAAITDRYRELETELSDPEIYLDQQRVQRLSQERARLSEVVETSRRRRAALTAADAGGAEAARDEPDPEMVGLFDEEERIQREAVEAADAELRRLLVPRDPNDDRDVIVEIRAGTGGDEAGLFAADLLRMYSRYAERRRWSMELISESPSGARGVQVGGRRGPRSRCLLPAQVRVRRPPGAAGPRDRGQGPDPHLGGERGGDARARRGRGQHRRERPEDRRLHEHRARRPERQHHLLGGPDHPPAERPGGHLPGREVADQEPGQGAPRAARPPLRHRPGGARRRAARHPPLDGRAAATAARRSAPTTSRSRGSPTTAST